MAKRYFLDKTGLGRIIAWVRKLHTSQDARIDALASSVMRPSMLAAACETLTAAEQSKVYTFAAGRYTQFPGQFNGFYAHFDTSDTSEWPLVRITNHGAQYWIPIVKGETYTILWGEIWKAGSTAHEQLNTVGQCYSAVVGLSGNEQARIEVDCRTSNVHRLIFTATASGSAQLYFIWNGPKMNCLTVANLQMFKGEVNGFNNDWYKVHQLDKLIAAASAAETQT